MNTTKNNILKIGRKMVKEHPAGKPYAVTIGDECTRLTSVVAWFATSEEAASARDSFNNNNKQSNLFAVAFVCIAMPNHAAFAR